MVVPPCAGLGLPDSVFHACGKLVAQEWLEVFCHSVTTDTEKKGVSLCPPGPPILWSERLARREWQKSGLEFPKKKWKFQAPRACHLCAIPEAASTTPQSPDGYKSW